MFLEHVNLTVSDLKRSIDFYTDLLGMRVRWQGTTSGGNPAAHVGDDRCYLALFQSSPDLADRPAVDYNAVGLNHFGFVVDGFGLPGLDQSSRLMGDLVCAGIGHSAALSVGRGIVFKPQGLLDRPRPN